MEVLNTAEKGDGEQEETEKEERDKVTLTRTGTNGEYWYTWKICV